jgi:histidinol-phosphate/aromatic aminotransferase/cobyric acid decarboxylase-like protein
MVARSRCFTKPGKPIEDVARELGLKPDEIIKLASNENPLGPSPKALAAMRDALDRAHFYPDGGGFYLREAIAKKFGLTAKTSFWDAARTRSSNSSATPFYRRATKSSPPVTPLSFTN